MSDRKVYFGNINRMRWVPAPNSGMGRGRGGWSSSGTYLNGSAYSIRSSGSHFRNELNWSFLRYNEVREILDYVEGVHGPDPLRLLDPFAADTNALSLPWSSPGLMAYDSPTLATPRPSVVATPVNSIELPAQGALFDLTASSVRSTFTVPVPPGYTFHFGWWGSQTGTAQVRVNGANVAPRALDNPVVVSGVWANNNVTVSTAGNGLLTVYGMMAQVLPTGVTPDATRWLSGAGSGNLKLDGDYTLTGYSAREALDYQSLTMTLVEAESWR